MPKHPEVVVQLTGCDGNAFAILGACFKAAKKRGVNTDDFKAEATSGDYDHLLQTCYEYFTIE